MKQRMRCSRESGRLSRRKQMRSAPWDTLSMGMTADLDAAIQAGSTMVRVGTGVFGARTYPAA